MKILDDTTKEHKKETTELLRQLDEERRSSASMKDQLKALRQQICDAQHFAQVSALGGADAMLEVADEEYGLFANLNLPDLRKLLKGAKLRADGTLDVLKRRARNKVQIDKLKQKHLQMLCTTNGIVQLRWSNEQMKSELKLLLAEK